MPLRLVRSDTNAALWTACAESFLAAVGDLPGPAGYPDFLLLTHRVQRDVLLERAAAAGIAGWLNPPLAFFSDLRRMFGIEARPVGILTGRMLVARLAGQTALRTGVRTAGRDQGPAGTHMLDRVFSELLPEGVTPERLREALEPLGVDDFSRRRNAWVAQTYEAFLSELAKLDLYDPRSIHAMVSERIEAGGLSEAIGGAERLHVLGVTSLRARQRLFRALAEQDEVEVRVYLPLEDEPSEWEALATGGSETVAAEGRPIGEPLVQPAPDSVREAAWVARRVKRLLAEGRAEPHEVAVVARSGHQDTRLVHTALEQVGVPSTARLRSVLAEIPVLKALLQLLRAEADGWTFERLRQVLASPYFSPGVDLRPVDVLAAAWRTSGLDAWRAALTRLGAELDEEDGRRWRRKGIARQRLRADLPRLLQFFDDVGMLAQARPERDWIDVTLEVLGGERFELRSRLCRPVGDRWDIVRLDQRGVEHVVRLLREWRELVHSAEPLAPADWYERLRRLLEANELALSTPLKEGVQVLEAHEASLSPFRHTFVVHANDGIFPRAPTSLGVFSDEERLRLRDLGLPLTDRSEAMRRERTLWRSVTRGENVTLTYRTTDSNGVPRLPSLMVPEHDPATELPRTLDLEAGAEPGTRAAADLLPVSPAQQRRADALKLKASRRGGHRGEIETAFPNAIRRGVLGAFADELRSGGLDDFVRREAELGQTVDEGPAAPPDPTALFGIDRPISLRPTAWNGKIRDPEVLTELERRFGPDYPWSSSQLETYGKRPFDFLLERVLGLEEVSEADEETSALTFGSAAHAILEGFYRVLLDDLPAEFDDRAARVLDEVADRVIADLESDRDEWLGLEPLWEVTRKEVRDRVRTYLEWELEHLAKKGEKPIAVELQFGFADQPPVELLGTDMAGQPARMLLRGRVDRVDRYGEERGGVLRVLDYKSGLASLPAQKGYQDGALLQTALYMMAVDSLSLGPVDSARYRGIRQPGKPQNKFELKFSGAAPTLRLALSIPGRVRAGLFEAVQAGSASIARWQPGRDVTRNDASLTDGTRFDRLSE
jgi:RecB family exonuclease